MKIGPRYLHRTQHFSDSDTEKAALITALAGAPGVLSIAAIEGHHKGGHRASLEVDRDQLDDFIAHMDSNGWMDTL